MDQNPTSSEKAGHPAAQAIIHEIRTAQNSAAHLLPKLQSLKDSNPQLKLLDVGAGSGTISLSFAKLIPDGHVTGIDVNASILPRAQANAETAGVKNIEFQEASVYKLPFADGSFDVVFCHQVLIHIGKPWDTLREMLRVTKPGGVVAAREGDYESECVWPEAPALVKFHKLMVGHMSTGGGTPTAGRQLLSWAVKAGAERSQITLSFGTSSYSSPSERKFCCKFHTPIQATSIALTAVLSVAQGLCSTLRKGALREKALKFDLATENDLEEMAKAWEEWAEKDEAILAMLQAEILIQK